MIQLADCIAPESLINQSVSVPKGFVPILSGDNCKGRKISNISGVRHKSLTAVGLAGFVSGVQCWLVACDCGRYSIVHRGNLFRQASCGRCIREWHGLSHTKLHNTWLAIKNRCHNRKTPGYKKYGAKGITVCDRWKKSFLAFRSDMGEPPSPSHSIDRIDPSGNYEPSNCRWATGETQGRNKTNSARHQVGEASLSVAEMAEMAEVAVNTIRTRLSRGWTPTEAATIPKADRHMNYPDRTTHGKSKTKVYRAWNAMKNRCNNKNVAEYANYGARGVKVLKEWEISFELFYDHVGDPPTSSHSLDRIDTNKGYEPGNVRWATKSEQAQNRRPLPRRIKN